MNGDVRKATVLLVEDCEADADITKYCLSRCEIDFNTIICRDGLDALDYILKRNGYEDAETPDIILLDIGLPKMSGLELLHRIKSEDGARLIPVVMLTNSSHDADVFDAYRNHANSYMQKPMKLSTYQHFVDSFTQYWLSLSVLPRHGSPN